MNIKKAIRVAMAMKNMQQKDISRNSGIAPGHLSSIINGKRSVGINTLKKIADALDMELSELVKLGE